MSVVGRLVLESEESEVVEIAARAPTRRLTPRTMMSCQKASTPSDQETVRVGKITTLFFVFIKCYSGGANMSGLFFAHFQKTQGHLQKNSSQLFAENSMSWRQLKMLRKKTQGIFKGTL